MRSVIRLAVSLVMVVLAVVIVSASRQIPAAAPRIAVVAADTPRSILAGAYTEEQASRGSSVFRGSCGNCHAAAQFKGTLFQNRWHGQPVYTLFDQLRLMMPMDNPGGLSAEEYAAVIAYMLQLNGYPTGDEPLPAADSALKQVLFERRPASQ